MSAPARPGGWRFRTASSSTRPSAGRNERLVYLLAGGERGAGPLARGCRGRCGGRAARPCADLRPDDGGRGHRGRRLGHHRLHPRRPGGRRAAAGRAHRGAGEQPDGTAAGRGRDPGPAAYRLRVPGRLDPHDRRHGAEDRAEPALDPADDRARPGLSGPDGQRRAVQHQAGRPQPAHRPGDHRAATRTRRPRPGSGPARTSSSPCCCSTASTARPRPHGWPRRAAICAARARSTPTLTDHHPREAILMAISHRFALPLAALLLAGTSLGARRRRPSS